MKKEIRLKPYIISGIIAVIIGVLLFVLFRFVWKFSLVDGFAIPAIVLVSVALLMWISREGFFDLLSYGTRQAVSMIFSKNPTEFNDYPGYKEYKNGVRQKRAKTYLSVLVVGLLFLVITLIVYFITKS